MRAERIVNMYWIGAVLFTHGHVHDPVVYPTKITVQYDRSSFPSAAIRL